MIFKIDCVGNYSAVLVTRRATVGCGAAGKRLESQQPSSRTLNDWKKIIIKGKKFQVRQIQEPNSVRVF